MSNYARQEAARLIGALAHRGFEFTGASCAWPADGCGDGWDYDTVESMLADVALGQDVVVQMSRDGSRAGSILLIPSNGPDMVSDWTTTMDHANIPSPFERAMLEVTAWLEGGAS